MKKQSEQKSEIKSRKTFVGVAALAREVGLSSPSVTVKLQRGMTPDQIRAEQKAKGAKGKATGKGKKLKPQRAQAGGSEPIPIRDDADAQISARREGAKRTPLGGSACF